MRAGIASVLVPACTLLVAGHGASVAAAAGDCPTLAAARAGIASAHPGIALPTALPARFSFVCDGPSFDGFTIQPSYGLTFAYGERHRYSHGGGYYFQGYPAAQLGVYRGHRAAQVVESLLQHDGTHGRTSAFSAGRFSGTRETQSFPGRASVDTFVWEAGAYTYEFTPVEGGGAALNTEAIIASFK